MKIGNFFLLLVIVLLLIGCTSKSSESGKTPPITEPLPSPSSSHTPGPEISESEAIQKAQKSICVEAGTLTNNAYYNPNSQTWWIDLNLDKPGCSPACVITASGSAEINWRCTGLITE